MNLRLLTKPLVAILLLSALACSKKDAPAASSDATGSYQLDSAPISCQAKASTSTVSSGGVSVDYLIIDLLTTPQPATGAETLRLYFAKPKVQSNNTYTLTDITLENRGSTVAHYFTTDAATLTTTSNGVFSGTFSGKNFFAATSGPYTAVTNGKFTNVRP